MTMTYVLPPVTSCVECGDDVHPQRPGDPAPTRCARCWQALVHPLCGACGALVSNVHVLPRGVDKSELERAGVHVDSASWYAGDPADRWVHPNCNRAADDPSDTSRVWYRHLVRRASWRRERPLATA